MDFGFALTSLLSLLAIMDPPGAIPAYLDMRHDDKKTNRKLIQLATGTVLIVLLVFGFSGEAVLNFFGISMAAFRAAGGVLLLLMAITMLHGSRSRVKQTPEEMDELNQNAETDSQHAAMGIVPLAIPLVSGPGAMTAVILLGHQAENWPKRMGLMLAIITMAAAVWLTFSVAEKLHDRIGQTGLNILTRVMGLILAAIAMQFIFDGVSEALPALIHTPGSAPAPGSADAAAMIH